MRPFALIIIVFLTSCLFKTKDSSFVCCPDVFIQVKVVNRTGLDGCGFMLQKRDSSYYEATNLPDSVKKEGKILCILFRPEKHLASTCMSGEIIHITRIWEPIQK